MPNIVVCARFRPLSSKEIVDYGDGICIHNIESDAFVFKDEKEEQVAFSFDKVFHESSKQADIYEFLALPIVQDAVNAINGTIITYGQTGAGKTYSMEGPSVLEHDEEKKGLLSRVVDGLFSCIGASDISAKHAIKLSMVEIYMERVRDLFDLSKDNIQIKEDRNKGILLSGVTEVSISDPVAALQSLSKGISNRAVGETQMNIASSRSHCIYMLTIQQELTGDKRIKTGKLFLVDLAGSEKVDKTGAEGKVLEEAKMINKSLSALGNVVNALTSGTPHIPYRDSKLTRILQDALRGKSRTALLCCCSPSLSNAPESLSALRFGARAKHIKASPLANRWEDMLMKRQESVPPDKDDLSENILLNELRERLNTEDVKLLEELLTRKGILVVPTVKNLDSQTVSALQQELQELTCSVEELRMENRTLKERIASSERMDILCKRLVEHRKRNSFVRDISEIIILFFDWLGSRRNMNRPW